MLKLSSYDKDNAILFCVNLVLAKTLATWENYLLQNMWCVFIFICSYFIFRSIILFGNIDDCENFIFIK